MHWYISHTVTGILVTLASLTTETSALWETSSPGTNPGQKTCDEIRLETTEGFLRNFQQGVPQQFLDHFVPMWVELALPKACRGISKRAFSNFNPSSSHDNGGPLGTLGNSGTIYTSSTKMRKKRETEEESNVEEETYGGVRLKREAAAAGAIRKVNADQRLSREKRFLHGMSLGGPPSGLAGPKKEVSESAQLMKMMLMLSIFQKNRMTAQIGRMQPYGNNFYGERVNFGGLYGDQYMGRKKREATSPLADVPEELSFSNTAEEPVVLMETPSYYHRRPMNRMFNSRAAAMRGYNPMMTNRFAAPSPFNPNMVPQSFPPPSQHGRKKRASENSESGSNNDVLTVGDVSIPMDFFKPSDDYQKDQPAPPQRYDPVYRQVVYRQPVYINRYFPYYQRQATTQPAHYYPQRARASQNHIYSHASRARQWGVPPKSVNQWAGSHVPVNRWARTQTPVNQFAQPQTPVNRWGQPQTPVNGWAQSQTPANQFAQPQTPVNRWGQPQTPVNQFAQPQTPVNRWGQPQTPVNGWGLPQTPANQFAQPQTPINLWPQQQQQLTPVNHNAAPPARPQSTLPAQVPPPPGPAATPQQPPSPFLPPHLPTPPHQAPPNHRRVKRSDNSDKSDISSASSSMFFPPLFFPLSYMMPMWSPRRFSSPTKMMVSNTKTGGAIYGDRMPWHSRRTNMAAPFFSQSARTYAFAPSPLPASWRVTPGVGHLNNMIYGSSPPLRGPAPMPVMSPRGMISSPNPYSASANAPMRSLMPQSNMVQPYVPTASASLPYASPMMPPQQPMIQPPLPLLQPKPLVQPNAMVPSSLPPQTPVISPISPVAQAAVRPPMHPVRPAPSGAVPPQSAGPLIAPQSPMSSAAAQPPTQPLAPAPLAPGSVPPTFPSFGAPPPSAALSSPFLPRGW